MTLNEIIRLLETNQVTPIELVLSSIEIIKAKDKAINAVVHPRFQQALLEAEKDYSKTVFKGMPILIKCLQDLAGEPSTGASFLLKDHIAQRTSHFVAKLQELGFIVLGQTNSAEFGLKNVSDAKLYGAVNHPLDLTRSPGGSSGGAAAALLAGYVPVVAASDGGGSIRIPASYCGLVGLKPTRGSMPTGPHQYRSWQGAAINFFITKTIEDAELMFESMKTNTIQAPFNYVQQPPLTKRTLKIAYNTQSPINSMVSDTSQQAVLQTVKQLRSLGHEVIEQAPVYDGFKLMESYYIINGAEIAALIQAIEQSRKQPVTSAEIELTSWVLYQYGLSLPAHNLVEALNYWDDVSEITHQFHQTYDLYLTPTTASTAMSSKATTYPEDLRIRMEQITSQTDKYQVVYDMFEDSLAQTPFTMLANITGQPAISLPVAQPKGYLPIGVQFMAAKGQEALLFDLSKQLNKASDRSINK